MAMAALTLSVVLLAIWQRDFVMSGIEANPYLNLTILVGMVLGVSLTFVNLFEMRDDFKALDGLYEVLEDARAERDPNSRKLLHKRREARLNKPAILFRPPRILGSSYLLLSQEIARRGLMSISNSTKKLLIEEIEERVDVRSNFTGYIASTMVMLGLLGTFIGLMETVGSVGTIISELDLSDTAGAGAIQGLINNLRAPLNGMATGFSSSLFGLVASLSIGILSRIVGNAANTLRIDFEHWINNVARLDGNENDEKKKADASDSSDPDADFATALQAGEEQLLWRAVRTSIAAQSGLRDQIEGLVTQMSDMQTARQAEMQSLRGVFHRNTEAMERQTALLQILVERAGQPAAQDRTAQDFDEAFPSRAPEKPKGATMQDWIAETTPDDEAATAPPSYRQEA